MKNKTMHTYGQCIFTHVLIIKIFENFENYECVGIWPETEISILFSLFQSYCETFKKLFLFDDFHCKNADTRLGVNFSKN